MGENGGMRRSRFCHDAWRPSRINYFSTQPEGFYPPRLAALFRGRSPQRRPHADPARPRHLSRAWQALQRALQGSSGSRPGRVDTRGSPSAAGPQPHPHQPPLSSAQPHPREIIRGRGGGRVAKVQPGCTRCGFGEFSGIPTGQIWDGGSTVTTGPISGNPTKLLQYRLGSSGSRLHP
jgi:hypothetical protein